MNSTKESSPETQEGWKTLGINVQRQRGDNIIQLGGISERRKREEQVLVAQHVLVDRYVCNVAKIN